MKTNIITIPFSKLLKLEVQDLAKEVIQSIERHEPETLLIDDMYNLLIDELPQISGLKVKHRGHPISKQLVRLRRERNMHVSAIKFELRKVRTLDPTGDDRAVLNLENQIVRFLDDFYDSENEAIMHIKINQFSEEIEDNEELADAMESLGFIKLLDNLKLNVRQILSLLQERKLDIAKRPKVKTKALKKTIIESIKNVFEEIRLAQLKNSDLDYTPLIDDINASLKYYSRNINIRKGYNERKLAERKKAEEENAEQENTGQTDTPTGTEATSSGVQVMSTSVNGNGSSIAPLSYVASFNHLNAPTVDESKATASINGSGSEKNNGQDVDQKKTVAETGNQSQQPSDSISNDNV